MSLRLILGRAGSGKTYRCLQEIQLALEQGPFGPPLILLVPEQATFQMEQALIKAGGEGAARARVLSFQRLAQHVFSEIGGASRPRLGEVGKHMLLRSLVYRRRHELELFIHGVGQAGFIDRLTKTLTEFREYGYSPSQVRARADMLPQDKYPLLAKKLRDLALLYEDYTTYIADRYVDPVNILGEAARALQHATLLEGAQVWVDGFAGFTPQEYRMLQAVFLRADRVNIALCLDPDEFAVGSTDPADVDDTSLFRLPMKTARELIALCHHIDVPVEPHTMLRHEQGANRFTDPILAHVERVWDKQPVQRIVAPQTAIALHSADDRVTEVEGVAAEIHRLVRDEGYRYQDISVVVRHLDTYIPHISAVFAKNEIPYFLDQRRQMLFHPLVQVLSAALEAVSSRWSSEVILRYLKTDLARVDRDEADRLENHILEHGITGWAWADARPWDFGSGIWRSEDDESPLGSTASPRSFDQLRKVVMEPLIRLSETVGHGREFSPREAAQALWTFMEDLQAGERIAEWIEKAEEEGKSELVSLHAQVWDAIVDLIEQMANVLPQDVLQLDELIAMVEEGLQSLKLGLIPPKLDQVLVGSIDRSRQPNVRAVFVLGLVDREFPAVPPEDAVFTDAEREALQDEGFILGETSRVRTQHEHFFAYIAVTRASERLILSTPRSDGSGRALLPSSVIDRMRRIFPALEETSIGRSTAGDLSRAVTPIQVAGSVIGGIRTDPMANESLDAYEWLVTHPDYAEVVKPLLRSLAYSNAVASLSPDVATALYGDPLITSVSRLERFASCPFQHFAAYGLGLKERAVLRLDPSRLGMLTHTVLKAFVDQLIDDERDWGSLSDDEAYELIDRLTWRAAKELAGDVLLSSGRHRYLVDMARRTLHTAVRVMNEHARVTDFKPIATELSFGRPGDPLSGWELDLSGGGKARVVGVIDRIDKASVKGAEYIRIVDYKSYQRRIVWSDILEGLELQLIVYLGAASKSTGMFPAGAFYAPIRAPFIDGEADLDPDEAWAGRKAKLRTDGILVGDDRTDIALAMDSSVRPTKRSDWLPFGIKKDGTFTAVSNVASQDELLELITRVRHVATDLASRIRDGEHDVRPFRRKNAARACERCPYHAVCRFDVLIDGNEYNHLPSYRKNEFWDHLRKAAESETMSS